MTTLKDGFEGAMLPSSVLADMFGHHLVVTSDAAATTVVRKPAKAPAPSAPAETPAALPQQQPAPLAAAAPAPGNELKMMGRFARNILVFVDEPDAVHCGEANFELLSKILAAVQLSANDIGLVNLAHYNGDYFSVAEQYPAAFALFFGVEPATRGLPMRFPQFQVQPWGKTVYLYAPALHELNGNTPAHTELKKQLWTALKRMFAA